LGSAQPTQQIAEPLFDVIYIEGSDFQAATVGAPIFLRAATILLIILSILVLSAFPRVFALYRVLTYGQPNLFCFTFFDRCIVRPQSEGEIIGVTDMSTGGSPTYDRECL
jgi:hypothetical protein